MVAAPRLRTAVVCAIVLLAGCRQLFGIDDTEVAGADGPVDPPQVDGPGHDGKPDAPAVIDARFCGETYVELLSYPGHTYRAGTFGTRWGDAQQVCSDEGAHLVVLDNEAENAAVRAFVGTGTYAWIGISDLQIEMEWTTVLNAPATYLPWASGEPEADALSDCGLVGLSGGANGLFYAYPCASTQGFVCECE